MVSPTLLRWPSCTGQRSGSPTGCAVLEQTDREESEPKYIKIRVQSEYAFNNFKKGVQSSNIYDSLDNNSFANPNIIIIF